MGVKTVMNNKKITYNMNKKSFINYVENAYQSEVKDDRMLNEDIIVTPIYILDRNWKKEFGESYDQETIVHSREFSFNSQFNCLNPSTLVNGYGIIERINKNFIETRGATGKVFLKLSSCSRVESTNVLPSVGQNIHWKGNKKVDRLFEVYIATCF